MQKKSTQKNTPSNNTVTAGDLILEGLNTQQRAAAEATDGPVLILAGAGSGKTKTLIHRIAYLIGAKGVAPWNILAVTFTNKAARNMQERMAKLLGEHMPHQPMMGTFHSVCSKLLRKEISVLGYQSNFVIFDADNQLSLVKKILKDLNYDTKQVAAQAVHWRISNAKNLLLTPSDFSETVDDMISEITVKVYPVYQDELHKHNALDFDDLIMKTVELFQKFPDILKKYQELWKYIVVDEYQDTNQAQYTLVTLLAREHHNLCVVGDDAQSVYSWRGADLRNILNFEKDYPDATVVFLEQNYRSTQTILDASNAVIAKNKNQKKKKLWTENPVGTPLGIKEVANEEAEGEMIVRIMVNAHDTAPTTHDGIVYDRSEAQDEYNENPIQEKETILERVMRSHMMQQHKSNDQLRSQVSDTKRDTDYSRFVILYRTNAQSRALEEAFLNYGIPYKIIGGLRFYERREIRDILAYVRAIFNPKDWVSLERIVNAPPRGLGRTTWLKIERFARERDWSVLDAGHQDVPGVQPARLQAFYEFAATLQHLREELPQLNPTEFLEVLLKDIGYRAYLQTASETREEADSRWENIQELKTVTQKFRNLKGEEGIQAFLEDVSLVMDQDDVDENQRSVKLMTIHAAKGLEFPVVFLVGMEEGLFPHGQSLMDPKQMEEERRLCYVALTRAQERLYVTYASQRMRYGSVQVNPPSRFIEDIPKNLVVWL
jgi:DNA helicase-2/ATP-dependent DNA helicase PcrA